jgi:hypothetical protein
MKILGAEDFNSFSGIVSRGRKETFKLIFESGNFLICTADHRILLEEGWVEAQHLIQGDVTSSGEVLLDIEERGIQEVFDALEVENGHSYRTNSVVSHNCNFLFIDEAAFIPNGIAEEFFTSVYPTISSGKTSKLVLISTPNGMNLFYKYYTEAVAGTNGFLPIKAVWSDIPGRDQKWADEQLAILGCQQGTASLPLAQLQAREDGNEGEREVTAE